MSFFDAENAATTNGHVETAAIEEEWSNPLKTLDELSDLKPSPPLIRGLINLDDITMIVGQPRSGKSFLTVGMACAVAHPAVRMWDGVFEVVEHGTVVYIAAEGANTILPRAQAWCEDHGLNWRDISGNFLTWPDDPQLTDYEEVQKLMRALSIIPDLKMLIIDTLSRVTSGLDENSIKDQSGPLATLGHIQKTTKAAVILVHHTRKDGGVARGASNWKGGIGAELMVARDGDEMTTVVTCTKRKSEEDGCSHPFDLRRHNLRTAFFTVTDTLVAVPIAPEQAKDGGGQAAGQANEARALRVLVAQDDGTGVTKPQWVTSMREDGMARNTAYDTAARLIRIGKVQEITVKKGTGPNSDWEGNGRYQALSGQSQPGHNPDANPD